MPPFGFRPLPACPAGEGVRRLAARELLHLPGKPAGVVGGVAHAASPRTASPAGQAGRGQTTGFLAPPLSASIGTVWRLNFAVRILAHGLSVAPDAGDVLCHPERGMGPSPGRRKHRDPLELLRELGIDVLLGFAPVLDE